MASMMVGSRGSLIIQTAALASLARRGWVARRSTVIGVAPRAGDPGNNS